MENPETEYHQSNPHVRERVLSSNSKRLTKALILFHCQPVNMSGVSYVSQTEIEVSFSPKPPIKCLITSNQSLDREWSESSLIFTHGAGGTLKADAIVNFTHGFVTASDTPTLLCFQGNMNLSSRVKMFRAVTETQQSKLGQVVGTVPTCLGGRSMGARAAVMAATNETSHLVLVSYPLHTAKDVRDHILLDLPSSVMVLFVGGDSDNMCDLKRLKDVRLKMKCKTWQLAVKGADHGMMLNPKSGTQEVGRMTGTIAAAWLKNTEEHLTEGTLSWDADRAVAQWSGWSGLGNDTTIATAAPPKTGEAPIKPMVPARRSSKRKSQKSYADESDVEVIQKPKPRKRRKP